MLGGCKHARSAIYIIKLKKTEKLGMGGVYPPPQILLDAVRKYSKLGSNLRKRFLQNKMFWS